MNYLRNVVLLMCVASCTNTYSQEFSKATTISVFTGMINYQGDLNPNSFTFRQSNFAAGITLRKPLNRWFALRAGFNTGRITAADRNNRDYLKARNLSFTTSMHEAYAALELTILDISSNRFTPYMYGGVAAFHFNPWTYDNNGEKTFLQPLGTEGQGLPQYPTKKIYGLTQLALPFGVGLKYAISDAVNIGVEFSQRKSFTDYIDDVSSDFADEDVLFQGRGAKAVELAYRGDEIPGGSSVYPVHGEQRGTPSEMDWYYFFGTTLEIKLNSLGNLFGGNKNRQGLREMRCPRFSNY
jgi:opacity protein-like surface antigen